MRFALGTAEPARFIAFFMKKPLMPLPSSRTFGRGRFGDEDIAVRQHVEPARVIEPVREGADLRAIRRNRLAAVRPAHGRRDLDGRYERFLRGRQRRVGARTARDLEFRLAGAAAERKGSDERERDPAIA